MFFQHFLIVLLIYTSAIADIDVNSFDRFTEDMPQLLETDAATVMVRVLTYDFANKLCTRTGGKIGSEFQTEVTEWKKRNEPFVKASISVLNEFGNHYIPIGGESAKQGYFQMILQTTTKEANRRVMLKLNGANLDNNIVPSEQSCYGLLNRLQNRIDDFENTTKVTQALIIYMQKQTEKPK